MRRPAPAEAASSSEPVVAGPCDDGLARLADTIRRTGLVRNDGVRPLVSAAGRDLAWCFDLRPLTLDADALACIARLFWRRWGDRGPFQVCGLEMAAVPLLVAVALEGRRHGRVVPMLVVRKERKRHGVARLVEGTPTRDPVLIVDDLLNSGGSADRVLAALEGLRLRPLGVCVLIDFASLRGLAWRARHRLEVSSLFGLADFGIAPAPADTTRRAAPCEFELAWRHDPADARHFHVAPKSTPLVLGDRVVFGRDDGALIALDGRTGAVAWCYRIAGKPRKGIWAEPVPHRGHLYFGAYDGNLHCVDAVTGAVRWRRHVADWIGSSAAPDVRRERIVVGLEHALPGRRGSVAALSMHDGSVAWEHPLPELQHGTPVLDPAGDTVFFGTNDGRVIALAAADGALRWERRLTHPVKAPPAVSAELGLVVVGGFDGVLRALSIDDGRSRFEWRAGDVFYSAPLVVARRCYAACVDKRLYVVDLVDGALAYTVDLGSASYSSPRLIDGSLFVGTNGGRVIELDPHDLRERGSIQLPERITNAIVNDPRAGLYYALSNAGQLFAFRRRLVDAGTRGSASARDAHRLRRFRYLGLVEAIESVQREVRDAEALWSVDTRRQTRVAVQRETESIALRGAVRRDGRSINDVVESAPAEPAARFPALMAVLEQVCAHLGATLGRAMIVRLRPGGRVYPHVDAGRYYRAHDRYHLDVDSAPGCTLTCGDECVAMRPGEVWWFDNAVEHASSNPSARARIHVVFDVRRASPRADPKAGRAERASL